jgi:hypothetical protein
MDALDWLIDAGYLTDHQMHELACVLAEQVAQFYGNPAWAISLIAAKRAWLSGDITVHQLFSTRVRAIDDANKHCGAAENMNWGPLDIVFASAWGAAQVDSPTALSVAACQTAWGLIYSEAHAAAFDATEAPARDRALAEVREKQLQTCLAMLDEDTRARYSIQIKGVSLSKPEYVWISMLNHLCKSGLQWEDL